MKTANLEVEHFYELRDRNDAYERQWEYINPVAAAYWRLRDELISEAVVSRFDTLSHPLRVLEVGVGHGYELAKFSLLGIAQSQLTGVDLALQRLVRAHSVFPSMQLSKQDASRLAFADGRFDIVCQFTCVMHVLSKDAQRSVCREMLRVLKPGGIVIWWDVAPARWRITVCRRLCGFLSLRSIRQAVLDLWPSFRESFSPSLRRQTVERGEAAHQLPISCTDVVEMFAPHEVQAIAAGLDFSVWEPLLRWNRTLVSALWRTGWVSRHCFAVITKQK